MAQVEIIAANLKNKENKVSVKNKKKRVCAYARVSTDSEEQLTSYSSQIKYYTEKIKANPDWEFVGIYADEGISGTQVKNRTEFQRMIENALNGRIDMIIAKSISRFARNTLDTLKIVRELREHNVDVYFEKENIHTLELDSEMFLTLYSAFAQAESESISQNVKLGLKAKMKRGECVGKGECYGFSWNKEKQEFEINEEQAEVVRMIFNWYVSGIGSRRITNKLNDMNIPSYKGGRWAQSTITNILHQEKYVGDLLSQKYYTSNPLTHKKVRNYGEKEKYYVKNHHKGIISRDVWDKSQRILAKRRQQSKLTNREYKSRYTRKYSFSSKIKCAFCGTNYVRRMTSKNKSEDNYNIYWCCYKKKANTKDCKDSIWISDKYLKEAFVLLYNSIIKNKHKTKELLLNAIKDVVKDNDYKKKIDSLYSEKEILDKRMSNLIDMKLDDYENKEAYYTKEQEINRQLKDIKEKIKNYEDLIDENKNLSKQIKKIEEYFEEPITLKEFNREAFDSMIDCILVGDYDENGNKLPRVARFILKTGNEFKFEIEDKKSIKKEENFIVSFEQENVVFTYRSRSTWRRNI